MKRCVLLLVLLAACATAPERPPSAEEALARAHDHVRAAFAERVLGDGSVVTENVVRRVTPHEVVWAPLAEPTRERRLFWADVDDVQAQQELEKPARPESVYVYLARGSRSVATADPVRPDFSGAEITRTYVSLRERASGTRARLARALDLFARARADELARAKPRPPEVAPVVSPASTEDRLKQLKDWHERGLFDDEVYREEQRKALAGNGPR